MLSQAEASARQVGMMALLSGGLPQRLDHVVATQLAQFDAELRKLDLDPKSGSDCSLVLGSAPAGKGKAEEQAGAVDCLEYRNGLEQQVKAVAEAVLRRQSTFYKAMLVIAGAGLCAAVAYIVRRARQIKAVKRFDKI
uniref:Uncharacterized protein n=1 Tax=Pyramimonas obovata TaxID=1411642 RepID=A0A7S0RNC0_9CHLO